MTGSQVPTTVAPTRPSDICTPVNVTTPRFCAVKVYVMTLPAWSVSDVVFVSAMSADPPAVTVTASACVTAGPVGGVPTTEAELVRLPVSTSAWVATYSNAHEVLAPGARVTGLHVPTTVASTRPSEICTPVRVTLPVLRATRA